MVKKHLPPPDLEEKCPKCNAPLRCGWGGGVVCTICPYWFCF